MGMGGARGGLCSIAVCGGTIHMSNLAGCLTYNPGDAKETRKSKRRKGIVRRGIVRCTVLSAS